MIATTTQFGGVKILAGKYSSTFLVGANAGQSISINISRSGGGYGASGLSLATISIATLAGDLQRSRRLIMRLML